jgi:flagella basal body P-ring formation protein FlgA
MSRVTHRAAFPLLVIAVAALVLLLGPRPAFAAAAVELRSDITAPGGQLTLGDLFVGAGAASDVVVGTSAHERGSVILSAVYLQRLAADNGLSWNNAGHLNRLVAQVEPARAAPAYAPGSRRAVVTAEVLVYARDFVAGDVVGPEDIVWATPTGFGTPLDAPRDSRGVIGQAVRRPIRAGAAVSLADLASPKVIKKDDLVTVAYAAGGIKLVLQGKAMSSASLGEAVDILNPSSKKTIQAVASGPDQAVVGPEAERIRSFGPSNTRLFASLN